MERSTQHRQQTGKGSARNFTGFYFKNGNLVSFTDFDQIPDKEFLPWTVQERVSGFLDADGKLYMVVNSQGFLVTETDGENSSFRAIRNLPLFAGRSAGAPFYFEGKVYCHLSWNTTFKTPEPAGNPVALAVYTPSATDIIPCNPLFQQKNPQWEAAELFVGADGRIYTAWKNVEKEKTEFVYTTYKPGDTYEKKIDRTAFLEGYGFVDLKDAPIQMKRLHESKHFPQSENLVVHYIVRTSRVFRTDYFRAGDFSLIESGKADLKTVPAFCIGESYEHRYTQCYALFPDGRLVHVKGETTEIFDLPPLPKGYIYTDFWTNGRILYLSFEEQKFVGVGNAGILVLSLENGV